MKFKQPFKGVKNGDIYPTEFKPGDEIPPELEAAAIAVGVVANVQPQVPLESQAVDPEPEPVVAEEGSQKPKPKTKKA